MYINRKEVVMKRLKLGSKTLNIKGDSLKRLIDSALSLKKMTRASVAARGSVSLATAGKLLSALDECRITRLEYKRDNGVGSPSKAHVFRGEISTLVLDFSSPVYSASIISGKDQKLISENYSPDPSLSFEGNATVFLSKVGQKMALLPYSASSVCTIIADSPECTPKVSSHASAYLPELYDMDIVNDLCVQFFGATPTICLTHAQAIKCALKYDVFEPSIKGESISHIRISDTLAATHLPQHSSPLALRLNKMMINGENLSSRLSKAQDTDELASVISHIIGLIDCAHESDVIVIEYDIGRFGGIEERIEQTFRAARIPTPHIAYFDLCPQSTVIGAANEALSSLIKGQITGV